MKAQLHLTSNALGVPRYRINPGAFGSGVFVVLELGPLSVFVGDPTELRRLADVAANAADVLEAAQSEARRVSSCCPARAHDAIRLDDARWSTLPIAGYQDDGDGGWLTLRNCSCGGTISRPTSAGEHARRDAGGVVMAVER